MYGRDLKILFVTSHCPYAQSYGAQLRVLNIAKLLNRVGRVSLLIAAYFPMDERGLERTRKEFDLKCVVNLCKNNLRNPFDRIRHELDPSFLKTDGVEACEIDREAMSRLIDEHDVIWVHTIRTANAFRIFRWPHTVLDIDDIPSRLFAHVAKNEARIIRSLLDYRRSLIWWRRERLFKRRFDIITVCSDEDRRYLGNGERVQVIPNGFDLPSEVPIRVPSMPPRIGYIGTFNYLPNRAGVEWFIRSVWPRIKREVPTVHLRLVGEGSDRQFPEIGADIEGLGWVSDPSVEIASWSTMIVPLHIGAGTRIKIAEAFSRKCPVVSTSLGAFGYGVVNGEDLLLADNVEDFASACVLMIKCREVGLRISENAWKKFVRSWTWDAIGASVSKAVEECVNRSNYELSQSHPVQADK